MRIRREDPALANLSAAARAEIEGTRRLRRRAALRVFVVVAAVVTLAVVFAVATGRYGDPPSPSGLFGWIVRYTLLALAGVFLAGQVIELWSRRRGGEQRATAKLAAAAAGLAVVLAVALLPALVGANSRDEHLAERRAELVDECAAAGGPRAVCACLFDELAAAGVDAEQEYYSLQREIERTGAPPVRLRHVAERCAGR